MRDQSEVLYLRERLEDLSHQFVQSKKTESNIYYSLANELNNIRFHFMEILGPEIRDIISLSTDEVKGGNGNPQYPATPDSCIQLSNQLSSIVDKIYFKEKKTPLIPNLTDTHKVFIVHGHDQVNLLRLQRMLRERYKIEAVILSETPSQGKTIIEKFEAEASLIPYCIALMTPDDAVTNATSTVGQSRPNVIFEIGWFYGRLGRSRVCILLKHGTKIHSDLDGVLRIEFHKNIEEAVIPLERELIQAGLKY